MSQKAVESILGRLVTDAEFRSQFLEEPASVCRNGGLDLTQVELTALLNVNTEALASMAASLDSRIVRAASITPLHEPGSNGDRPQALPRAAATARRRKA